MSTTVRKTKAKSAGNRKPVSGVEASLMRASTEALAFVKGDSSLVRTTRIRTARNATVKEPPVITAASVRALRDEYALSQDIFARVLGVSPETLKGWEQGKKTPSGPAVRLLQIAREYPDWITAQIDVRSTR